MCSCQINGPAFALKLQYVVSNEYKYFTTLYVYVYYQMF